MAWRNMSNSQKSEALMGAAILAVILPSVLGFFAACVAAIIYGPWVIKIAASCIGLSTVLAIASWLHRD